MSIEQGDIAHPGYENRSKVKSCSGYQNIVRYKNGATYLIINAINSGKVDISTPEKLAEVLAWRDSIRAKRGLPKAKY